MNDPKKPSLQNIPIHTERGRAIRKAFMEAVPKVHGVDYAEMERRILETMRQKGSQ